MSAKNLKFVNFLVITNTFFGSRKQQGAQNLKNAFSICSREIQIKKENFVLALVTSDINHERKCQPSYLSKMYPVHLSHQLSFILAAEKVFLLISQMFFTHSFALLMNF
jgi:hypothetical protein